MTSNFGSAFLTDLRGGGIDEGVRRQAMDSLRAHDLLTRLEERKIFVSLTTRQRNGS